MSHLDLPQNIAGRTKTIYVQIDAEKQIIADEPKIVSSYVSCPNAPFGLKLKVEMAGLLTLRV
jgi:hypothetical protein